MKRKLLNPEQIITLRDYPVYNEHILKIYFRVFAKNQGKIMPPCPVVHISLGIPYANGKNKKAKQYNTLLKTFLNTHPRAKYFLLDGSHKTTAATLSHKLIPAMIIEHDKDFKTARELIKKGDLFGWHGVENSIEEAMETLTKHHIGSKKFLTVKEKTQLMIKNKDIPKYMIKKLSAHP